MGEHSLLALQRLDSRADALSGHRAGLGERGALRACEAEIAALASERDETQGRRIALGREERRVEGAVADLEARVRKVEGTLYSGKVTAPRELESLQTELRDFQRRQGEREQEELALMEREEQIDGEIAVMDARRDALGAQAAELGAAIRAAESQIDAELERIAEERSVVILDLPGPLLAAYERLRLLPRLAGRAAAVLDGGTCGGCGLALPIAEVGRIRREVADAIALCPNCGRILVH